MTIPVTVEIETSEAMTGGIAFGASRWAALRLNGVTVYRTLVFDTDKDGNRTDEQAANNLLLVLQSKMQRLLEDA